MRLWVRSQDMDETSTCPRRPPWTYRQMCLLEFVDARPAVILPHAAPSAGQGN